MLVWGRLWGLVFRKDAGCAVGVEATVYYLGLKSLEVSTFGLLGS